MSSSIFLPLYRNLLSYIGFFSYFISQFFCFFSLLCLLFSLSYFFLMELLYFFPVFFKLFKFLHESYIMFLEVHLGNSHCQTFLQYLAMMFDVGLYSKLRRCEMRAHVLMLTVLTRERENIQGALSFM